MGLGSDAYSPEKLEKLLRHAKVTQQSIQTVSHWMLEHRAFMADMVDLWTRLFLEGDANHQIVNLYIANDAMQVGARKYGKHVAEVFESKLLEIAEFVMASCDEKVKRCLMKIVGIWKQRNIVHVHLLDVLQNVCAGKPAIDPVSELHAMADVKDEHAEREELMKQMLSETSIEQVLEEMPEVLESEMTSTTTQRLQNLVSATISADLLSDRMFQLESSLNNFHQACEAFEARKEQTEGGADDSCEVVGASGGNIEWELMEQQVFDVDIEKSRDHVQQYRDNLEEQSAKREELLEHLQLLQDAELFTEPLFVQHASMDGLEEQCRTLEKLYLVCAEADSIAKQREAEKQAAYMITSHLNAHMEDQFQSHSFNDHTGSTHFSSSSQGANYEYQSYSSQNSSSSYAPNGGGGYEHQRSTDGHGAAPILRRHSSSDSSNRSYYDEESRYGGNAHSKRPKLQHAHSLDSHAETPRPRWQPRLSAPSETYRAYHNDENSRYSPRESSRYSPSPQQRQQRSGGSNKWDRRPDDNYDRAYDRGGSRRW